MGQGGEPTLLPPMQTRVMSCLLWDLRRLTELHLPERLREVGEAWFAGSGIRRAFVPASVSNIQKKAFYHCPRLRGIIIAQGTELESVEAEAFD